MMSKQWVLAAAVAAALWSACKTDEDLSKANPARVAPKPAAAAVDAGVAKAAVPVDEKRLRALSSLQVPGFTQKKVDIEGEAMSIDFESASGPRTRGRVQIAHCKECKPMDIAAWRADHERLKSSIFADIRNDPKTIFEIAGATIHGRNVVTTYSLGFIKSPNLAGHEHAFVIYYNDGVNQYNAIAADGVVSPANNFEEYKSTADRGRLESAARALFAAAIDANK